MLLTAELFSKYTTETKAAPLLTQHQTPAVKGLLVKVFGRYVIKALAVQVPSLHIRSCSCFIDWAIKCVVWLNRVKVVIAV